MVSRTWCFTINNYTDEDKILLHQLPFCYLIYGHELSKTGTPHLQGYVTLQSASRLSGLHKRIPRAHWEQARSVEASKRYCMKDGNYRQFSSNPNSRKSSKSGQPRSIGQDQFVHKDFIIKNLPLVDWS